MGEGDGTVRKKGRNARRATRDDGKKREKGRGDEG